MKNITTYIVVLILTTACSTRGFKPPPYFYDQWYKLDMKKNDVKKSLLECGADAFEIDYKIDVYIKLNNIKVSDYGEQSRCMLKLNFVYKSQYGDICTQKNMKNLPGCAPDAIIPTPSAERRLNSPFCIVYTKAEVCQP